MPSIRPGYGTGLALFANQFRSVKLCNVGGFYAQTPERPKLVTSGVQAFRRSGVQWSQVHLLHRFLVALLKFAVEGTSRDSPSADALVVEASWRLRTEYSGFARLAPDVVYNERGQ